MHDAAHLHTLLPAYPGPRVRLSEHIIKWFIKKPRGRTVSIFIDAEKAFDTVWHGGLRKMLYDAKVPFKMLRIISNFLDNRHGYVKVNQNISSKVPLTAGVPQGSILSPLLYIFFIRQLPSKTSNEIMCSFYADNICYSASDNPHKSRSTFAATHLQQILIELESRYRKLSLLEI